MFGTFGVTIALLAVKDWDKLFGSILFKKHSNSAALVYQFNFLEISIPQRRHPLIWSLISQVMAVIAEELYTTARCL